LGVLLINIHFIVIFSERLELDNISSLVEHKALELLDSYSGANNYILFLKQKKETSKKFYPTRAQADYIINYFETTPKVARKWVELDTYFAKKFAEEKYLLQTPEKIYIEKLLVEKEKSYHVWGKFFKKDQLSEFWVPKSALIKTHNVQSVEIDYSKYSHRPPLNHQKIAIERLVGSKRFILADDMGVGKCEYVKNEVFTPIGRKKIGDLKVGDKVIGSDGKSHNVIGVFLQGVKETYKITFNDGFSILVGDEHLWSVSSPNYGQNTKNKRRKKSLVLSTKQMFEGGKIKVKGVGHNKDKEYEIETYFKSTNGNNKWQIPIVQPIQFERNDNLPIDPYLLGLILGDGHLTKSSCVFTVHSDDYDELFGGFNLSENKQIDNKRKGNKFIGRDILCNLKLNESRSHNKFIPEIYKYSSIENRLSILQGLMDTDGHCMYNEQENFSGTEYSTISKQLCDDVVEIVQTLGGIARVKTRIPTYTYNGEKKKGQLSYRVNIKLPKGMNPFRLKRKAEKYIEPIKYPTGRFIKNIEKVGFEESVCISVDSPDKLYVTEHCIVTHNTTSTIIASLETGSKKILIVCPASLKINWQREIENYSDRSVFICEGKKFSTEHDFVIINYDILKNFHDPKSKEPTLLEQCNFDLVILDEAHMISNAQAQRTKIINSFVKKINRVWLLTGTPMTSRPMNYYNLLSIIESPVAQNWMAYAIRYCQGYQFKAGNRKVWNVTGASNLEELRDRTSKQILRRLKEEVLDLPDKIITPVYLRLQSKEYENLMGEYYDWYDKNPDESSSLTVQFSKLMKVRKVIANEKTKQTIEFAENILEQEKKVIIFTNFTDSLRTIYHHFKNQAVYLDGSCSNSVRQQAVDSFQNDDKIKVFVGNLKAAGVGLTLTSAEVVIINDLSFVPAEHAQAEDRAYRYGQKSNVLVYYPLYENTIEGVIYDILNKKKEIIRTVMGDQIPENVGDVVEEILNLINKR
jgi:superfamily II DNA or RNA helicase